MSGPPRSRSAPDDGRSHSGGGPSFEQDYLRTLQELRGALIELFTALEADIRKPLELTRVFGMKRNLGWKTSKLLLADDPFAAFPYLPSASGLLQFLKQLEGKGLPPAKLDAVRAALHGFESMVEAHVGDRVGLELVLESVASERSADRSPLVSRQAAFRGNCGIWGIEAKVRLNTHFLAPSADAEGMADLAAVTGLVGLYRYRSLAKWPLGRREVYDDELDQIDLPEELAIDPASQDLEGPKLLPEFCSSPLPPIRTVQTKTGERYEFAEGRIGRSGETDVFYASAYRSVVPYYADGDQDYGQFECSIEAPVRTLQFDCFVHRGIPLPAPPQLVAAGRLTGDPTLGRDIRPVDRLPMGERVQAIGTGLRVVGTPHVSRYAEICSLVHERMGWDPDDFLCYRLIVEYPPLSSSIFLTFGLPERPA